MKKFLIPALLIVFVWSCSRKATPAKSEMPSSSSSAPIIADKPMTPAPASTAPTAGATPATATATDVTKTPAPRSGPGNDAAAIAGQAIYNAKCNRCHAYKITFDYTVDRWISVMQVMAVKANLTDIEKENVLAYVTANAKR